MGKFLGAGKTKQCADRKESLEAWAKVSAVSPGGHPPVRRWVVMIAP